MYNAYLTGLVGKSRESIILGKSKGKSIFQTSMFSYRYMKFSTSPLGLVRKLQKAPQSGTFIYTGVVKYFILLY